MKDALDYSPESLNVIESYILKNFDKDYIADTNNQTEVDAVISYYAETFMRCLPDTRWDIILEKDNIEFNLPLVVAGKYDINSYYPHIPNPKVDIGLCNFNPYHHIHYAIKQNKGTTLYDLYIDLLDLVNNPEDMYAFESTC